MQKPRAVPEALSQRLRTCSSFPTPPPVALRVIELAQDPDIDISRVAEAVSADPAIAAKVMRIANSALYSRRRHSTNLRQALIMLGLNATLTLALSFTLVANLRRNPPHGFDFSAYWRRALLSATWAKLLATEIHRRDAEEIFLAALLQDIGMLAIDRIRPEVYENHNPFDHEHAQTCQHELGLLDTDHRAVGAELLRIWNLPPQLGTLLLHSHGGLPPGLAQEQRAAFACVVLAGELSEVWMNSRNEMAMRRIGQQVHRQLGILPNRLAAMFDEIRQQLPVAEALFEMSLFEGPRLQEITDTAREILMVRNLRALEEVQTLQSRASRLEEENVELKQESSRDALTGVFNRRHFEESLLAEFATARRHGWPLSVIFVDLDRFKQVNDSFGHQAGDDMLREVSDLLVKGLRDSDQVARYGGDEFVLLLPGIDADNAAQVGARLVSEARLRRVGAGNGAQISITLSLGIATLSPEHPFAGCQELLAAADTALYHSKRNGRDRHTLYASIEAA